MFDISTFVEMSKYGSMCYDYVMKVQKRPIPAGLEDWLREIAKAFRDARETIPFAEILGESLEDGNLFHLAPFVALKFRGFPPTGSPLKKARDAALSSYVANFSEDDQSIEPLFAFAFCYVSSHYGLGLLTEEYSHEIISFVEENIDRLQSLIDGSD